MNSCRKDAYAKLKPRQELEQLTVSIGKSLARMTKWRKRDQARVAAEYDLNAWTKLLLERPWENYGDLDEFLLHWRGDKTITAMIDGELARLELPQYLQYRREKIASLLLPLIERPEQCIVEIGSGWGENLFGLRTLGISNPMLGLELSQNGIAAAKAITKTFACEKLDFAEIDLLDPTHPGFSRLKGCLVFSYYCLEQLPRDTEKVLRTIASAQPSRVLHVEPGTEFLSWKRLSDVATWMYVVSNDYQRSLLSSLQCLAGAKVVQLIRIERERYAPNPVNFPVVAIWTPV